MNNLPSERKKLSLERIPPPVSFRPPPDPQVSVKRHLLSLFMMLMIGGGGVWLFLFFQKKAEQAAKETQRIDELITIIAANVWETGDFGIEFQDLKMASPAAETSRADLLWTITKIKEKQKDEVQDVRIIPGDDGMKQATFMNRLDQPIMALRFIIDAKTSELMFLGVAAPPGAIPESPRLRAERELKEFGTGKLSDPATLPEPIGKVEEKP